MDPRHDEYDDYWNFGLGLEPDLYDWPRPQSLELPRTVWQFPDPWARAAVPVDISAEVDRHVVGEVYRNHYGAPGTGYRDWECTRVDHEGVWGYTVQDTLHVLEPWEVE